MFIRISGRFNNSNAVIPSFNGDDGIVAKYSLVFPLGVILISDKRSFSAAISAFI